MNNEILFHGKNLACAYSDQGRVVLKIKEIIIPRNKVVFLLGSSGSGKSTLLETLGMMNNTLKSGELKYYLPNGEFVLLNEFWNKGEDEISELRKKNFSFIFQQTNLMENFTAYENVCLSGMIKEDAVLDKSLARAEVLMDRVKLYRNEVGIDKMPSFLSGGQRQRLSFVRALCNDSSTLFCDEPTGNLDESNANELLEVIKEATREGKTAIIVSHDINLALRHADIILVLTKDNANNCGELLVQNIFERNHWEKYSSEKLIEFRNTIKNLFITKEGTIKESKTADSHHTNKNSVYQDLFVKREFISLLGKRKLNLFILVITLFLTFLAVGFANGSLNYLNEKMNSAFVNLINFKATLDSDEDIDDFIKSLDDPSKKAYYQYEVVSKYMNDYDNVYKYVKSPKDSSLIISFEGTKYRTVDPLKDRKFIQEQFLSEDNFIAGDMNGFKGERDHAIIVTKDFLKEYGYPADAHYIYYRYLTNDTTIEDINDRQREVMLPIPVRAIVKSLPDKYYFLRTIKSYASIYNDAPSSNKGRNIAFSPFTENRRINFFIKNSDALTIDSLTESIYVGLSSILSKDEFELKLSVDSFGHAAGFVADVELTTPAKNYLRLDTIYKHLIESASLVSVKKDILRFNRFNDLDYDTEAITFNDISVYFKRLDMVGDFAKYVKSINKSTTKSKESMEIDISKVQEKKNFMFLSKVTNITSYLLIFFSTVAISLFIFFLLRTHLNKIQMNIGTFKAIGLSDKISRLIYFKIILRFIFLSLFIGLVISFICGYSLNLILLSNVKSDDQMNYFIIFKMNTVIALLVILSTSLFISWFTIKKILSKTPGDLIYNR